MNKNTNLLVVIATHNGDFNLTEKLVEWIGELDGLMPFPVLFWVDREVDMNRVVPLFEKAKTIFSHARAVTAAIPATGHKPNSMFLQAAKYVKENYGCPFLWLEPDCVPMKPNWLADISEAYQESPLRYMGAVIEQTGQKNLPAKHLTGCSVYPPDAYLDFSSIPDVNGGRQAWDIGGGERIVTASQHTNLIHHFWGQPDKPPIFVEARLPDSPENHVTLDFVKPDAVLFHRCKDGGLIPLLRKLKPTGTPPAPNGAGDGKPEEVSDAELEKSTSPNPPAETKTLE